MRSVQLNQEPVRGGGVLSERAVNRLIDTNTGDIRFFVSGVGSVQDSDFQLVFEESIARSGYSVEYRLENNKWRVVLAPASTEFTDDHLLGDSLNALADRVIDPAVPLLPVIRAYQRRVREEEKSAIYASVSVAPKQGAVAPDENLSMTLQLIDCDEGNPPLPDRQMIVEFSGVGGLDR